jgi:hypothetical protein
MTAAQMDADLADSMVLPLARTDEKTAETKDVTMVPLLDGMKVARKGSLMAHWMALSKADWKASTMADLRVLPMAYSRATMLVDMKAAKKVGTSETMTESQMVGSWAEKMDRSSVEQMAAMRADRLASRMASKLVVMLVVLMVCSKEETRAPTTVEPKVESKAGSTVLTRAAAKADKRAGLMETMRVA